MIEPLKVWKSEKVKNLLEDFFEENFLKANVEKNLGAKIINQTWNLKSLESVEYIKNLNIKLFNKAKRQANSGITEIFLWDLFDLEDVKTFVDVGANKLRRINELAGRYPHIKEFVGVDVVPQVYKFSFPDKSRYVQIEPDSNDLGLDDSSVDMVSIQYALHHFESDNAIRRTLQAAYKALKPEGRLLIWEESFAENVELRELASSNNQLGIETDLELTKRFYDLSDEEKLEFIIVNDWIINVNNPHMQWTGLYKPWEDWQKIVQDSNFRLSKFHNLGLRKNAMIKQGVHVIGEFRKC